MAEPIRTQPIRTQPIRRVAHHLRRYPRWYAVAAIWLVGMIALPVIKSDAARETFNADAPAQRQPQQQEQGPPLGLAPLPPLAGFSLAPTLGPTTTQPARVGETPLPEPEPLDLIGADFFDTIFDLIPSPPALPPLPPQLEAVIRAAAPIAAQGCTGLGLAALVIAVVAPSVEGVPIERILPYLAPVTSACAFFPIPKLHTVCAADEPLIIDVGGLTKTPPILGLGIDQLTAIEDVIASYYGDGFPRLSDTARETLDCKLVSE